MEAARRAARLEKEFIEAFERNLRAIPHLVDPRDGKLYSLNRARIERRDRARALLRALREQGRFSRQDLFSYPVSTVVSVRLRRFLSSGGILVVAASLTRFEPFLKEDSESDAAEPLGAEAVQRFLRTLETPPGALCVCGFFSATGWEEGTLRDLEDPARICLTAPGPEGTWIVLQELSEGLKPYRWLFDPEGREGRIERLCGKIAALPELSVAGGFVPVERVAALLGTDGELVDLVLRRLLGREKRLCVEEVDGVQILKHRRV